MDFRLLLVFFLPQNLLNKFIRKTATGSLCRTPLFIFKLHSVAHVARFTKSVDFTFLIAVGNLGWIKINFWLVVKPKKEQSEIIIIIIINIVLCISVFTDKNEGKFLTWPLFPVDRF